MLEIRVGVGFEKPANRKSTHYKRDQFLRWSSQGLFQIPFQQEVALSNETSPLESVIGY